MGAKILAWLKAHHLGWLAVVFAAVAYFFLGRHSSKSGNDVGFGNPAGITGDLESAADQTGAISNELATSADTASAVATDLGKVSDSIGNAEQLIGDVVEGFEDHPEDLDRADFLISELLKRHGEESQKAGNTE